MAKDLIFIVEDESDILELVSYNLTKEGYRVRAFTNGEDMLRELRVVSASCILLDLMLPGMDGLDVCREIRSNKETSYIPVIMMTAKGEDSDIISGLELGADDYIVKPFSPKVLIARIKAILRRKREKGNIDLDPVTTAGIEINPGRHEVIIAGKPLDLTASEFKALHFLAQRPGWVFTRYQIVEAVHGSNYPVTDRSVDVLIVGLRKKLGDAGNNIETVRGIGYRFKSEE